MASALIGSIAGLVCGAYLLGLAVYQLKHKVLITGSNGRGRMTGPVVWVFAPLEGLAGAAMLIMAAAGILAVLHLI